MKNKIIILILLLFTISCSSNEPEEVFFKIYDLEAVAEARRQNDPPRVYLHLEYSFKYEFINCYGQHEIVGGSLPDNHSFGGAYDQIGYSTGECFLEDDLDVFLTKALPDSFKFGVGISGKLFKKEEESYIYFKDFKGSLEKEIEITRNY